MSYRPINDLHDVLVIDFASATVLRTVSAETISAELESSVSQTNTHKVVLDFSPMIYLTSEMVGGLIKFRRYCARNGVALKFCNLSGKVKSVFSSINLDMLFDCYGSCDEAVVAFNNASESHVVKDFHPQHQEA